ncbi:MAG: bis(5'-nucleosyl)-tetraphosphatase (symmetrical) YqeK [Lachnospiraceae bacterium]|nr:bis(5'-nucleosyl)-tetraphosphatase (symmetrical) YqeK [Lachnospiraceae bacterium]
MELKKITKLLEKELESKRFEHTKGVEYTAASLAIVYDVPIEKALYAGLLHDCAKGIPGDEQIKLCEKYDLPVSDVERDNPGLLHAKLGAYLAKTVYEVDDEEVLNAIKWHTTGRPAMTMLEKIVFIADYIEPNRKMLDNMYEVRKLAFTDIDAAIKRVLGDTLKYLGEGTKAVDPMTKETFDYYNK